MTDKLDSNSELNNEPQQATDVSKTSIQIESGAKIEEPIQTIQTEGGVYIEGNIIVSSDFVGHDRINLDKVAPAETQYPFSISTLITISSLVTLITGIVISDRLTLFIALPIALLFIAGIALYRMAFAREYNPNLSYNIYFSKTEQDIRTVTAPFKYKSIWRYIMIASGILFHLIVIYIVVQYVSPSLVPLSSSILSPIPTPTP